MGFFDNTRNPKKFGGKIMVAMMNRGHAPMAEWGLSFFHLPNNSTVLDIGCGGGANVERLANLCSTGKITGIDYSEVSVKASKKKNREKIKNGQCEILKANVLELPFPDKSYDAVTAFETVYFWPNIETSFSQVFRVLKDGGSFLICNECDGENPSDEKWTKKIKGMQIYNKNELRTLMENMGVVNIELNHDTTKHRLCIIAHKPKH